MDPPMNKGDDVEAEQIWAVALHSRRLDGAKGSRGGMQPARWHVPVKRVVPQLCKDVFNAQGRLGEGRTPLTSRFPSDFRRGSLSFPFANAQAQAHPAARNQVVDKTRRCLGGE